MRLFYHLLTKLPSSFHKLLANITGYVLVMIWDEEQEKAVRYYWDRKERFISEES